MKTQKEIFKSLVSDEITDTITLNKERISNRNTLRIAQDIALMVLDKLEEKNWTVEKLAQEMNISVKKVNKIVKGSENLTLQTQVKLQEILNIRILATS